MPLQKYCAFAKVLCARGAAASLRRRASVGEAQVCKLEPPPSVLSRAPGNENVRGLDVPVVDAVGVHVTLYGFAKHNTPCLRVLGSIADGPRGGRGVLRCMGAGKPLNRGGLEHRGAAHPAAKAPGVPGALLRGCTERNAGLAGQRGARGVLAGVQLPCNGTTPRRTMEAKSGKHDITTGRPVPRRRVVGVATGEG